MKYKVYISRLVEEIATVEVEADNTDAAISIALDKSYDLASDQWHQGNECTGHKAYNAFNLNTNEGCYDWYDDYNPRHWVSER